MVSCVLQGWQETEGRRQAEARQGDRQCVQMRRTASAMNHRSNSGSGRAALLGFDQVDSERLLYAQESEDLFERDNDQELEKMVPKAADMKKIGLEIEMAIKDSVTLIDGVSKDIGRTQSMLDGTMDRLKKLSETASSRHMCYLVCFIVIVFLVLYFLFSRA